MGSPMCAPSQSRMPTSPVSDTIKFPLRASPWTIEHRAGSSGLWSSSHRKPYENAGSGCSSSLMSSRRRARVTVIGSPSGGPRSFSGAFAASMLCSRASAVPSSRTTVSPLPVRSACRNTRRGMVSPSSRSLRKNGPPRYFVSVHTPRMRGVATPASAASSRTAASVPTSTSSMSAVGSAVATNGSTPSSLTASNSRLRRRTPAVLCERFSILTSRPRSSGEPGGETLFRSHVSSLVHCS